MRHIFLLLISMTLIAACSSSKELMEKGKYKQAFDSALSKLKKGKSSREDKQVLNSAFNQILNDDKMEIGRLEQSTDLTDLEQAYLAYDNAIDLYDKGSQYLESKYGNQIDEFRTSQENTRLTLVDQYWNFANQDLQDYESSNDKSYARSAYTLLSKVKQYKGIYPDLNELQAYAYESAIIKVGIDADAVFALEYDWEVENVFEDMEGRSGFMEYIYEPREQVDCFLDIDLEYLDFDTRESRQSQQVSENIQDGFTTVKDEDGNSTQVPKYIEVYGTVISIITEIRGQWTADVDVDSYNNECNFRDETFRTESIRTCEYYEYEGDQRARPNNINFGQRMDCNFKDEMVNEMLIDLYNNVVREYK